MLDGNIVTKSDNTGITTDYVYNNAGMLTSETVSNALEQIQNTAYSYDNRGNRIGVIGTGYDEYTETYTYDLNNRLTKLEKVVYNEYDHPDNIFSTWYNYDFNGNLFSENVSAIRKSLDNPSITMNVFGTGDDNWNHEVGLTIYNYNLNNQLVNVAKDGKTATYTYNPDGYRSSKTVDGVTTNHIWNGTQIVAETNSDDTIKALYVYGNRRIYNEQNGTKSYYLYDAHGDTKHLTNSTGSITCDYTYDAFGNELDLSNDIVDTTTTITEPYNPFRYCGEYFDEETGFIYLRARYYSPEIGRFVSEDPVFDGVNWYTYCGNNPIIYHDPNGKALEIIFDIVSLGFSIRDVISDPTDVWAWVGLAGDIIDVVVPVVAGVGEGIRAVNVTRKAAGAVHDTSKVVETTHDTLKAADTVYDTATETAKNGKRIADTAETTSKPYRDLNRGNFRENFKRLTGMTGEGMEAHHVLPHKFAKEFEMYDIKIDDPIYGTWVDTKAHRGWSYEYNQKWKDFFENTKDITKEKILQKGKELSNYYGFDIHWE